MVLFTESIQECSKESSMLFYLNLDYEGLYMHRYIYVYIKLYTNLIYYVILTKQLNTIYTYSNMKHINKLTVYFDWCVTCISML